MPSCISINGRSRPPKGAIRSSSTSRPTAWLAKYLTEARPELAAVDTEALFLTDHGEPIQPHQVADKVKRYMGFAGVDRPGSTHLLRHACATHMLEGGADIRFIQEMLEHANLQTTEIYTHVSIDKLIAVHKATHPSRLERKSGADDGEPQPDRDNAAAAILDALAREDEDATDTGDADAVAAGGQEAGRR